MANPVQRIREILHGLGWALQFDNGLEIIADRHIFRRSDPIRLVTDGVSVVVNYRSSDIQAVKDVLREGMYDTALQTAMKGKREFNYLNLGANIGTFDLRALQLARSHGMDVRGSSVEMNPTAYARLILNLELNKMEGVLAVNAALQGEDGVLRIEAFKRDTGQRADDVSAKSLWAIPAVTWKTLWEEKPVSRVDLLKVDIEGAERFFLQNLTAGQAADIGHIIIETHSPELHELCDGKLAGMGFQRLDQEETAGKTRLSFWKHKP